MTVALALFFQLPMAANGTFASEQRSLGSSALAHPAPAMLSGELSPGNQGALNATDSQDAPGSLGLELNRPGGTPARKPAKATPTNKPSPKPATPTLVRATSTPTRLPPPTATRTATTMPPTATRTATASRVPPTATPATRTPTQTPTKTATLLSPTATITPTSAGGGTVYYVATTGNDTTGNGTIASPWGTIAKGVSVLNPGDTLYIRNGTYLQTSTLRISRSGTAAARITISSAPGEWAVISGDANGNGQADATDTGASTNRLVYISGSFINFQNLEVAFAGAHGVDSWGTDNVIAGNKVHYTWTAGIWAWSPRNTIEHNTVWRTNESNYCGGVGGSRQCNGGWSAAIVFGRTYAPYNQAPNTIVRHNTVYNNSGEGIMCMQTEGAVIEDNTIYDNWTFNIDVIACSYSTVQRNLTYYTGDTHWWKPGTHPSGAILLSNEIMDGGGADLVGHDNKIVNNLLVGSNLIYWGDPAVAGSALVNYLIANNTIVNDQGGETAIYFAPLNPGVTHVNTRLTNNLILQATAGSVIQVNSTTAGLSFDHNLWSQTPPSFASGPGDVIGNPLLADPFRFRSLGSVIPGWYKLTASSPAIDAGTMIAGVGTAFDGAVRPNGAACDDGAFEY